MLAASPVALVGDLLPGPFCNLFLDLPAPKLNIWKFTW
jgi:hypothetical protein